MGRQQRHQARGYCKDTHPDGDIFGGGKEPVNQDSHERRIETELHRKLSQLGIGHSLGNHDRANRNACHCQLNPTFRTHSDRPD